MRAGDLEARLRRLLETAAARRLRRAAGAVETHLVGGALRDAALDLPRRDLDAVVARDGRAIAERYARLGGSRLVELGGERFAAYRLVDAETVVDLWDRQGATLHDDLERRDLTVNSIALDLNSGQVVDPFGGLADLAARRLRATTERSFAEDPLRVLRLARLAGALVDFSVQPATLALARRAGAALDRVAAERVRDELAWMLGAPVFGAALDRLVELALYPRLWRRETVDDDAEASAGRARALIGALDALLAGDAGGLPSGLGPATAPLDAAPGAAGDRAGESRRRGDPRRDSSPQAAASEPARAAARSAAPPLVERPAARQALLCEALEPGEHGAEAARRALDGLRARGFVTRRLATRAARLLEPRRLPGDEAAGRRLLHASGDLWSTALAVTGARATVEGRLEVWRHRAAALRELAATAGSEVFAPDPLLDGREIGALLDLPPGPELGAAVAALERRQVEGSVRSRRQAADYLRRWKEETAGRGG